MTVKRLIQYGILVLLTVALIVGTVWARDKALDEKCTRVEVEVINADSTSFVTPSGVIDELRSQGIVLEGKSMGRINASEIEEALKMSPYLESADIVKCQNGRLLIRVSQLVPIFRVFDGESSYYVNRAGKHMSANAYYHSDVPVVQGHFTRKYPATRLLPLIDYVEKDSLLHSLVTMYCLRDTNNIIIVPAISGHVVNIGNASDFENKFAKLKLFYREVMPKKGWNTYDTISVQWNHQEVATRRIKAVQESLPINLDDDEQAPDLETVSLPDKNNQAQTQAEAPKADDKPKAETPKNDNQNKSGGGQEDNKKTTNKKTN